jgi:MFS family permease
MSTTVIEHADGLPQPQRSWAILTIALGLVMSVIDGSIANVALPTIAGALHASPAFSIWIFNGYQLAITISLLPLASLGEIIGYRRVNLAGLVLFTLASVFCAVSHTLLLLTIARIMQGFGAAGILSVNAALVRYTYPRAQLGRGIGVNALVVAVSAAVARRSPRPFWRSGPGPICSRSTSRSASSHWRWVGVLCRIHQPPFTALTGKVPASARRPLVSASPRSTAPAMVNRHYCA